MRSTKLPYRVQRFLERFCDNPHEVFFNENGWEVKLHRYKDYNISTLYVEEVSEDFGRGVIYVRGALFWSVDLIDIFLDYGFHPEPDEIALLTDRKNWASMKRKYPAALEELEFCEQLGKEAGKKHSIDINLIVLQDEKYGYLGETNTSGMDEDKKLAIVKKYITAMKEIKEKYNDWWRKTTKKRVARFPSA